MRTVTVLQNTDWEHLGLVEDHLEGRNIRFRYVRPNHDSNWQHSLELQKDGLIVLGSAPYGTVSKPQLPHLMQRIAAIESCLKDQIPVIGFGTGTQLLAFAAGASAKDEDLAFTVETAYKTQDNALNDFLPDEYPLVIYMRDFPSIPSEAEVLSETSSGRTALFQIFGNCFGFIGHPGIKTAMIEDSFVQIPEYAMQDATALSEVRACQKNLEDSLVSIMTGLIQMTGWMQ